VLPHTLPFTFTLLCEGFFLPRLRYSATSFSAFGVFSGLSLRTIFLPNVIRARISLRPKTGLFFLCSCLCLSVMKFSLGCWFPSLKEPLFCGHSSLERWVFPGLAGSFFRVRYQFFFFTTPFLGYLFLVESGPVASDLARAQPGSHRAVFPFVHRPSPERGRLTAPLGAFTWSFPRLKNCVSSGLLLSCPELFYFFHPRWPKELVFGGLSREYGVRLSHRPPYPATCETSPPLGLRRVQSAHYSNL